MNKIVKFALNAFVWILIATAALVLIGLGKLWFFPSDNSSDLPYLGGLITALIFEVIAVVIAFVRKGFKYIPHVESHKDEAKTMQFMEEFIAKASTIQIVSNRVSWLKRSPAILKKVEEKANEGNLVELFLSFEPDDDIRVQLEQAGVHFHYCPTLSPEARFTLINGGRSGAERLAIARGSHPDHEVTVFDNDSGPQIIGMAKDIIKARRGNNDA